MSQKSILNFFKPLGEVNRPKRGFSEGPLASDKRLCSEPMVDDRLQEEIEEQSKKTASLITTTFGHSWFKALKGEMNKPYFLKLNDFVGQERSKGTVYPCKEEVFSWTEMCPAQSIKVVILGQDPYHGPRQAHGLAFSVKKGVPPPPSLVNIFTEVKNNYPYFTKPGHGDLSGWARQGVLLLNACLSVRANNANSHANQGWEQFTDAVIKYLNDNRNNIVFLLWGSYAQRKGSFIDTKKHLVLKSVHPSPLSAYRGFIGCEHFKRANEYLLKKNIEPIDWTSLE